MEKETLTLSNITKDLKKVASLNLSNIEEWRFSYIIPITLSAVIIGIFLKSIWIGLLIFSVAVYHIIIYIKECKRYKIKKQELMNALDREDISISIEQLSHISEEIIYEPHTSGSRFGNGSRTHMTKTVKSFNFMSGGSWRVPKVSKHYEWSKDYYVSTQGLENISLMGDEFFYICLQGNHDISYIYPCKCFKLDSDLKLKD